ncbi:MAG TPA: M28 family peptidase [Pirellulales bacterium]|nr:M28 family peptidase [Pirellulales bacterium]
MNKRVSGQTWFLASVIAASCAAVAYVVLVDAPSRQISAAGPAKRLSLEKIPFDGTQAYEYLQDICALGSRVSGSPGMIRQQEILREHFEKQGAKVEMQPFRVRHPVEGTAVEMANMIIQWQPDKKDRLLVAAHYDTRPRPDQDPVDPRGPFLGANDGASGVALLMQLGEYVKSLDGKLGVDFVLFDGEEFIFSDRDEYFLGSTHFAEDYVAHPPGHRYKAGVLLDMIGDKDLEIYQEGNSVDWPASRSVVNSVWAMAKKLGVREFVPRVGVTINDDHIPLNRKAKIPTCDVIDFDYPYWHTRGDTADKCSALSLAKVGWVISEWLKKSVQ